MLNGCLRSQYASLVAAFHQLSPPQDHGRTYPSAYWAVSQETQHLPSIFISLTVCFRTDLQRHTCPRNVQVYNITGACWEWVLCKCSSGSLEEDSAQWIDLTMGIRISTEFYKAVACVRPQSCRSSRSEDRALNPITTFLGRKRGERGKGHRLSPVATDAKT